LINKRNAELGRGIGLMKGIYNPVINTNHIREEILVGSAIRDLLGLGVGREGLGSLKGEIKVDLLGMINTNELDQDLKIVTSPTD
jgi:hypothetical protein